MTGRVSVAAPTLLSAGTALVDDDVDLGRQTLLEALDAAFMSSGTVDDPRRRRSPSPPATRPRGNGSIVDAAAGRLRRRTSSPATSAPSRTCARRRRGVPDDVPAESLIRWSFLVTSIATALWDHDGAQAVMNRVMTVARDRGSINWLAVGLQSSAPSRAVTRTLRCGRRALPTGRRNVRRARADARRRRHRRHPRRRAPRPRCSCPRTGRAGHRHRAARPASASSAQQPTRRWCCSSSVVGDTHRPLEHATALIDHFPIGVSSTVLPNVVEAALRAGQPRDGGCGDAATDPASRGERLGVGARTARPTRRR